MTLVIIMLHVFWGIVFFDGCEKKKWHTLLTVLLTHLLVSTQVSVVPVSPVLAELKCRRLCGGFHPKEGHPRESGASQKSPGVDSGSCVSQHSDSLVNFEGVCLIRDFPHVCPLVMYGQA